MAQQVVSHTHINLVFVPQRLPPLIQVVWESVYSSLGISTIAGKAVTTGAEILQVSIFAREALLLLVIAILTGRLLRTTERLAVL